MNTTAKRVFIEQAEALQKISQQLGGEFDQAIEMILMTQGRVVISGMGKSGIIGSKIAATLASTGTPSFYVHPGEAYHGDLGMFKGDDTAILISYSGETDEVIRLIPSLKHFGIPIISIIGNPKSTIGRNSDLVLNVAVGREACPNNLAPTTSTTATLVMGDALAVTLIERRDFRPADFARFHPGGSLGRKLLTRVGDVMHTSVPWVSETSSLMEVISSMTKGALGLSLVHHHNKDPGHLAGIITDGDLRRALVAKGDIYNLQAQRIMSQNPFSIKSTDMFADAEAVMLARSVTALVVLDENEIAVGIVKLLDSKKV